MVLGEASWGVTEAGAGEAGIRAASLAGTRAPIVLVHGLGCSHRYFRRLAGELHARGHAVAGPDLPGFGLTPGPARALDVAELAAALASWLRATARTGHPLVANSFGAQVLVELAAAYPDVPGPLVLIGPALDRRTPHLAAQVGRLVRNTVHESPRVAVLLGRDYLVCGLRRYLATAEAGLHHPTERRIRDVGVPVTVVRGAKDPLSSRAWAAGLAGTAGGSYVEVPGAAHLAHWSRPAAVADAVEAARVRT